MRVRQLVHRRPAGRRRPASPCSAPTTAETLFGSVGSAVGQRIRISGQPFTVIGVTTSKGSSGFANTDDAVYIPFETFEAHLSSATGISTLYVEATSRRRR